MMALFEHLMGRLGRVPSADKAAMMGGAAPIPMQRPGVVPPGVAPPAVSTQGQPLLKDSGVGLAQYLKTKYGSQPAPVLPSGGRAGYSSGRR